MIGLTIEQAKEKFFDSQKIIDAERRATLRALSRFGAFVRQRAKSSIRPRRRASEPGEPPSSHVGRLRDNIFFVVEPDEQNVVIGPAKINKPAPLILQALEHGGETLIMGRGRNKGRMVPAMIQPRPFMQPAFDEEYPKAAYLW